MGSDCWVTASLNAECSSLDLPGDLCYEYAWHDAQKRAASEEQDAFAEGAEGKAHLVDEDIQKLMDAGFSGSVEVNPNMDESYYIDFRPGRRMMYSASEYDYIGQLLEACFKESICQSCRHRAQCALGEYARIWEPRPGAEGIEVISVAAPKGIKVHLSRLTVLDELGVLDA